MMSITEYIITAFGWTIVGGLIGSFATMVKAQTQEMQAREDGFKLGLKEAANSEGGTFVVWEHKKRPFDWSTDL